MRKILAALRRLFVSSDGVDFTKPEAPVDRRREAFTPSEPTNTATFAQLDGETMYASACSVFSTCRVDD